AIDTLNAALKDNPDVDQKVKNKLKYITKEYPTKIQEYQEHEAILEDRNSYSKTDKDATFMRMKEDHMNSGFLKAGYNVQISTNNQYILAYSIHSNPTDTTTLIPHLEKFKENYGVYPKSVIADAGYGSQENYTYLEGEEIKAFVKYNTFDQEQEQVEKKPRKNAKQSTKPFTTDKLFYQHKGDYFVCPMGQKMHYIGDTTKTTTTGFIQTLRQYQAKNCQGCPLNGVCHKAKGNRTIEINFELQRHRKQASKLLTTKEGIDKRKQRCHDVETVFGNIKQNHGFRRFMLRGKEKVAIEWGLLAIAQNIRKRAA
ncbi:transposase, partial [Myroides odoratimimus]